MNIKQMKWFLFGVVWALLCLPSVFAGDPTPSANKKEAPLSIVQVVKVRIVEFLGDITPGANKKEAPLSSTYSK